MELRAILCRAWWEYNPLTVIVDAISIRVDLHSFCISSRTCQSGTCTGDSARFGREMSLPGMRAGYGCVPGQSVFVRQIYRQVGGKILLFGWLVGIMQMQSSRRTSNPYHTSPDDPEAACFLSQLWLEHGGGVGGHIPLEGTHDWVPRLSGSPSTSMPFRALPPHSIFSTSNSFLALCAQYPVVALCGDILDHPEPADAPGTQRKCLHTFVGSGIAGFIYFLANHATVACRGLEIDDFCRHIINYIFKIDFQPSL